MPDPWKPTREPLNVALDEDDIRSGRGSGLPREGGLTRGECDVLGLRYPEDRNLPEPPRHYPHVPPEERCISDGCLDRRAAGGDLCDHHQRVGAWDPTRW